MVKMEWRGITLSNTKAPFFAQWVFLLLALMALGVALGFNCYRNYLEVENVQGDRLRNQARVVATNIDQQLESVYHALLRVRGHMTSWQRGDDWLVASSYLTTLVNVMPGVRTLLIINAEGTVVASDREALRGREYRGRELLPDRFAPARPCQGVSFSPLHRCAGGLRHDHGHNQFWYLGRVFRRASGQPEP